MSTFLPTSGSWLNLHLLPLSQLPALKNAQRTVLGSTPKGTFCVCTGLNKAASSFLRFSSSNLLFSRNSFSFSFASVSLDFPASAACAWICFTCFCTLADLFFYHTSTVNTSLSAGKKSRTFFMPKVFARNLDQSV